MAQFKRAASVSGEIGTLDVKREAQAEVTNTSDIEMQRSAQAEASDALNNAQEKFYSIGGEVSRIEQALKYAQERRGELQRDLIKLEATRADLAASGCG